MPDSGSWDHQTNLSVSMCSGILSKTIRRAKRRCENDLAGKKSIRHARKSEFYREIKSKSMDQEKSLKDYNGHLCIVRRDIKQIFHF